MPTQGKRMNIFCSNIQEGTKIIKIMFLGTNGWFDSSTGNTISVLTLSMNRFSKGLYIIVQKGGKEILKKIINASFTAAIEKLPYYTEVIEV
jgi:hypothetical protein